MKFELGYFLPNMANFDVTSWMASVWGAARIKKIKQLRQRLAKTERYVNDKAACNITSKVII